MMLEDLPGLDVKITEFEGRAQGALQDHVECRAGEDTHDSPGLSHASASLNMWETELANLRILRQTAEIITAPDTSRVSPGTRVVLQNLRTDEEVSFIIGGDRTFDDPASTDTDAPRRLSSGAKLAQLLMGAKPGQRRTGDINGRPHDYEVLSIGSAVAVAA
jgi:transcription elongation GreA/GreB family factor